MVISVNTLWLMEHVEYSLLWGEAINHAIWLKNKTAIRALLNGKTPYKMWVWEKTKLCLIKGMRFNDNCCSKLDGRSEIGHWVGCDEASDAYCIYWPDKCQRQCPNFACSAY